LLIKPFFDVPAENARNYLCRFERLKTERFRNAAAHVARWRHRDVLGTFSINHSLYIEALTAR
jgi:hypothetical protein